MSTAHEFEAYRLIDLERLEEVRVEFDEPDYSIEHQRAMSSMLCPRSAGATASNCCTR